MIIGVAIIWLLALFSEWAVWKRVMDDPLKGKMLAVLCGYLGTTAILGFTMSSGSGWNPAAIYLALPGTAIVGFFFYKRGEKLRDEQFDFAQRPDLEDTFG